MVYGPTGNRVAWLPLYNLNCKARNTPVDKTGVNFSCCSQGVLRTVDAPSLLFRLNRALELIRCCEKELCEIQTYNIDTLDHLIIIDSYLEPPKLMEGERLPLVLKARTLS